MNKAEQNQTILRYKTHNTGLVLFGEKKISKEV